MTHEGLTGIIFDSLGYRLLGRLFLAAGDGPKPTAVILHGLAGIEQNHDLAFALRDHGWNAAIFHYRGCWGSAGTYNFSTLPEDVRACLDYLSAGVHPEIDVERIVLIGHSMGGWAAVMAAVDARARAVATIAPVVRPAELHFDQTPEVYAPWLTGLSNETFARQWQALQADPRSDTTLHAGQIAPRPLLVIHARYDRVVPVTQGLALYDASQEPHRVIIDEEGNHSFVWRRDWLGQQLLDWLDGLALGG